VFSLTNLLEPLFSILVGAVFTLVVALKPFAVIVVFVVGWRILEWLVSVLIAWLQQQFH